MTKKSISKKKSIISNWFKYKDVQMVDLPVEDVMEIGILRFMNQMVITDKRHALNVVDKEKWLVLDVLVMAELDVMFVMVFKY